MDRQTGLNIEPAESMQLISAQQVRWHYATEVIHNNRSPAHDRVHDGIRIPGRCSIGKRP